MSFARLNCLLTACWVVRTLATQNAGLAPPDAPAVIFFEEDEPGRPVYAAMMSGYRQTLEKNIPGTAQDTLRGIASIGFRFWKGTTGIISYSHTLIRPDDSPKEGTLMLQVIRFFLTRLFSSDLATRCFVSLPTQSQCITRLLHTNIHTEFTLCIGYADRRARR